jgi:hypothetical protein
MGRKGIRRNYRSKRVRSLKRRSLKRRSLKRRSLKKIKMLRGGSYRQGDDKIKTDYNKSNYYKYTKEMTLMKMWRGAMSSLPLSNRSDNEEEKYKEYSAKFDEAKEKAKRLEKVRHSDVPDKKIRSRIDEMLQAQWEHLITIIERDFVPNMSKRFDAESTKWINFLTAQQEIESFISIFINDY